MPPLSSEENQVYHTQPVFNGSSPDGSSLPARSPSGFASGLGAALPKRLRGRGLCSWLFALDRGAVENSEVLRRHPQRRAWQAITLPAEPRPYAWKLQLVEIQIPAQAQTNGEARLDPP